MRKEINEKTKARLIKLLALAERGVGGEKLNAQRMLDNSLKKYGMTLEDLTGDQAREERKFRYGKKSFGRKLMLQCIASVVGANRPIYRYRRSSVMEVEATASEALEIELKFEVYRRALEEQISLTFDAFIQANRVFPERDSEGEADDKPLSEADRERLGKLLGMVGQITPTPVYKSLPG